MTGPTERRLLYTDIETYSSVDIRSAGAFKYIESPDFEIMLVAYAWGDEPVKVLDLFDPNDREEMQDVLAGLRDLGTLKIAHNNAFERNAYRRQYGFYQPPEEWDDTMILCAMNGLPMSLDAAGSALQLPEQKLKEGTSLINYFCKPCKPTIANGGRTRNLPHHAPEKWARFKAYAGRDVVTMRDIHRRLRRFPIPDWERKVWALDTRINERGVLIDTELAQAAIDVDEAFTTDHSAEMKRLTGLENPNSVAQLKEWLGMVGLTCESLSKTTVVELLDKSTDPTTRRVLELRQLLGKTSTKKYQTMITAACADDRVRGLMQYYGAGRTGRWAGRIVQPQNLPQNHLAAIDKVRELVRQKDLETLEMVYDNVPDVLSQLIRTSLIAKPGHTFLVADYSAIEARVINYLSGETWANEAFANGEDIYCKTASMTFGVPVVKHGINGHLRQRGKVMVLGLGYGMGVSRFEDYAATYGVHFEPGEAERIVSQWRQTSPTIPKLWRDAEKAAKNALKNPGKTFTLPCGVKYRKDADALRCRLPSGRILSYWGARLENGAICFMAQNQTTRKWEKSDTWGGKLVENCWSGDTLVLTDKGPKPIKHVSLSDRIWDGVEWVTHSGIISKGEKETIVLNGCQVTPDHKILTLEGWKRAEDCDGLDGMPVWNPNNNRKVKQERPARSVQMDSKMRLWKGSRRRHSRRKEVKILRMLDKANPKRPKDDARNESSPGMGRVALNAAEMHRPKTPSLEKLRRTWNYGLRQMVTQLREFLGRHGADVSTRFRLRQTRQQPWLQPRELPLDDKKEKLPEQKKHSHHRHPVWANDGFGAVRTNGYWPNNFAVSNKPGGSCRLTVRTTRCSTQVYDIKNCGPRHRYSVVTDDGLIIAHNCVQAYARDCLAVALLRLDEAGYKTVFHVHDEVIVEEPIGGRTWEDVAEVMGRPIDWAPGLLLIGDGYSTPFYMKKD